MSLNFSLKTKRLMPNSNTLNFNSYLKECEINGTISKKLCKNIACFYEGFKNSVKSPFNEDVFITFINLVKEQIKKPGIFANYHQKIEKPFDYYQFGIDFVSPLVDKKNSKVFGEENLFKINNYLNSKKNVILFANHQSESDPQIISILLQDQYKSISKNIIFIAGERVLTDPLAIPFSLGCDLLCIYSKKHIDNIPEKKSLKQLHNKKTMVSMHKLLKEGGKIIYLAPSGGRDRKNARGIVEVSSFDPQSIEMIYLMAKGTDTHFFPLSLSTYNILPPPDLVEKEIGEKRFAKFSKASLFFGDEIKQSSNTSLLLNKKEFRKFRAKQIYSIVNRNYNKII
jgi:glycerol-3-phosphate O-acyltransferase